MEVIGATGSDDFVGGERRIGQFRDDFTYFPANMSVKAQVVFANIGISDRYANPHFADG
ncbi:MAG: hypothetical protein PVSMB11_04470 [Desulfuromonadaceae bacterium]